MNQIASSECSTLLCPETIWFWKFSSGQIPWGCRFVCACCPVPTHHCNNEVEVMSHMLPFFPFTEVLKGQLHVLFLVPATKPLEVASQQNLSPIIHRTDHQWWTTAKAKHQESMRFMLDQDAIADPHSSWPIPKCHVCIWSGGASVGPRPGTRWRAAGESSLDGQAPGRDCRHSAVRAVHHQSWCHSRCSDRHEMTCTLTCSETTASEAQYWQTRALVKPVISRWHFPLRNTDGATDTAWGFATSNQIHTPEHMRQSFFATASLPSHHKRPRRSVCENHLGASPARCFGMNVVAYQLPIAFCSWAQIT